MADIVWRTTQAGFPVAYVGVPYEAGLAVTGNATAITNCVVASGALPPGLSISADFVRVTGTVVAAVGTNPAGTYTFTLTMTDTAGGVTSGSYSIKVEFGGPSDEINNVGGPGAEPLLNQLAKAWPLAGF